MSIRQVNEIRRQVNISYLLPDTSMNLIATAILGSIKKFVNALMRKDAESDPIPRLESRTSTPAC